MYQVEMNMTLKQPGLTGKRGSTPYSQDTVKTLRDFRQFMKEEGLMPELQALEHAQPVQGWIAILGNWLLIFASWWLVVSVSFYFIPLTILLMGNRQRALSNLLHEASHCNLGKTLRAKSSAADLFLAAPFFNSIIRYRELHREHHLHLGSDERDPDFIHKESYKNASPWRIMRDHIFNLKAVRGTLLGQFFKVTQRERVRMFLWWAVVLTVLALVSTPLNALLFFAMWMFSIGTVYHSITMFREVSDHVGLEPGTLVGFSRNSPIKSLGTLFFHPHNNAYHLAHHMDQRVPFNRLPQAHKLFMKYPPYAAAHHCDGYFMGKHSLMNCWTGKCNHR